MIAIPIDSQSLDAKSSKLFGNVNAFAIYKPEEGLFTLVENSGCGNGIKTAEFLKTLNVTDTIYSYMGDGPFNFLNKENINVHYIGKEPMGLDEIVQNVQKNSFIKLDSENASKYLDPGTATDNCECSCSH